MHHHHRLVSGLGVTGELESEAISPGTTELKANKFLARRRGVLSGAHRAIHTGFFLAAHLTSKSVYDIYANVSQTSKPNRFAPVVMARMRWTVKRETESATNGKAVDKRFRNYNESSKTDSQNTKANKTRSEKDTARTSGFWKMRRGRRCSERGDSRRTAGPYSHSVRLFAVR